jgi:hypothetical protein
VSPRDVARLIAAGRIAIGAALLLAPRRATLPWIGVADASRPGAKVLARAMGARDVVIGAIALHTLGNPQVAPRWQKAGAAVDGVDLAATLAARRELPRGGVALVVTMATFGVSGQLWAAAGLGRTGQTSPPQPAI